MSAPLWEPSSDRIEAAHLTAFVAHVSDAWDARADSFAALHRWSVDEPEKFWRSVWDYCGVIGDDPGDRVALYLDRMPGTVWFPEARLNFAENLLRRRDDAIAVCFRGEDGSRRSLTHAELRDRVARLRTRLREWGVGPGDRVAAYVPNLPETVVCMLAAASLGAVWSSCSPDFGVRAAVDRFGQIEPKVLIAADAYFYNGTSHDCLTRIAGIRRAVPSIERQIVIPYTPGAPSADGAPDAVSFDEALGAGPGDEIDFARLPFDHPLYILFSSGTTGRPKCIVHAAGGTLLQHLKEHQLHADLKRDDRFFYFTTCGWMMWNWLMSGLASGATLVLYDGSPFHPDGNVLFDLVDEVGISVFGTSAKFIDAVAKADLKPARTHDLGSVKTVLSTGSPLAPESFDFVYKSVKRDVCLSSISGGTDIVSCFVGGNAVGPVWRGEIQVPGLGMSVDVVGEGGHPVRGEKGELVCTRPFPSMPVGFWSDADGSAYRAAYFEKIPGAWCQGDFAEITEHDGFVIHGRSDAVLNPGGVRIGTAEIYRQAERVHEVVESLAIGQDWEGDTRLVLFVMLRDGCRLDAALEQRIRDQIRRNATPRHVPARIVEVADIPRTKSGKIVELAVRDIVHGRQVTNRDALANPDALDLFADRPELQR